MDINNLSFSQIKEKLEKLEIFEKKFRENHNKACLNYYHKNIDRLKEYRRLKAEEYYDRNKNDPAFMERKKQNVYKSLEKKRGVEKNI